MMKIQLRELVIKSFTQIVMCISFSLDFASIFMIKGQIQKHHAQKIPWEKKIIQFPGLRNPLPEIHGIYNLTTGDVMIHTTVQSQSSTWTLL